MTSLDHERGRRGGKGAGGAAAARRAGAAARSAGSRRLSLGGEAAVAAAVSRAAVFAVVVVAAYVAYRHGDQAAGLLRRVFVVPWTHKDAGWFVSIAREGYGGHPGRPAFFPLYPLLVRIVSVVTFGNYWAAGIAVSLLSYAGAMALLFALTAKELSRRAAFVTVTAISVFPTAFVFSAVYSESLFLLLSVATFFFATRRRWAAAAVMGLLATLTRSSGVLLAAPLLLMIADQQGWMTRRPPSLRRDDLRAAWILLVPAGLAAYMAYLWARFGDPLRFVEVQRVYWHRAADWPWTTVWRGLKSVSRGYQTLAAHPLVFPDGLLPGGRWEIVLAKTVLPLAALIFAVVCLVIVFRRLPAAYGVYALLALLLPLVEPSGMAPLYSYHRFVLVAFPLFMGLGAALEKRTRLFWALAAASLVLMLYLAVCFVSAAPGARGVV